MSKYTDMQAGDMLLALGDHAKKWADAFSELYPQIPHDIMVAWFSNAIEHSYDVRKGRLVRDDQAWEDFKYDITNMRNFLSELEES